MSFSPEDLAQLGAYITEKVESSISAIKADLSRDKAAKTPEQAAAERAAVVGIPDVPADAGPLYWVHLANGTVIESHDSASTHVDVGGVTVPVTGRWEIPEGAPSLLPSGQGQTPESAEVSEPTLIQEGATP